MRWFSVSNALASRKTIVNGKRWSRPERQIREQDQIDNACWHHWLAHIEGP